MQLIGSTRRSASVILQQAGLAPFRSILSPDEFERAAHQAGCGPKRKRPLVPEVVSWLMMLVALETTSMTQGLCRAWGLVRSLVPSGDGSLVSEEAFSQARAGLIGQSPLAGRTYGGSNPPLIVQTDFGGPSPPYLPQGSA